MKCFIFALISLLPGLSFAATPPPLPVLACIVLSVDGKFNSSLTPHTGQYFIVDLNKNRLKELELRNRNDSSVQTVVFDQALVLDTQSATDFQRVYRGFDYIDKLILSIQSADGILNVGEIDETGWRISNGGIHAKARLSCHAVIE